MLPKVVIRVLTYRLTATIWEEPEWCVAKCSELGAASAGDFPSDALANWKEATELYLESAQLIDSSIPIKPFVWDPLDDRGIES
ncbi:MAG: type II toxin-antitoxin system HicB family antitoxin [Candidatus Thorarchaeota archaeon]